MVAMGREAPRVFCKTGATGVVSAMNWQDLVHKKHLHVNGVEQDCENLRSGNGEQLVPNETELAARDIEDLIAGGVLLTDIM